MQCQLSISAWSRFTLRRPRGDGLLHAAAATHAKDGRRDFCFFSLVAYLCMAVAGNDFYGVLLVNTIFFYG